MARSKCTHCGAPTVYEIRPERHRCIICGRSKWMEFKLIKPIKLKGGRDADRSYQGLGRSSDKASP